MFRSRHGEWRARRGRTDARVRGCTYPTGGLMLSRTMKSVGVALAASAGLASAANAAGPPPPTSTNGHAVQLVASGLSTPTSFAFGGGAVFEGDGGAQSSSGPPN